jgi:DNA-binding winged helix-turn-helix (wHTH) protein
VPEPVPPIRAVRYRFGRFLLDPARRQLLADDAEVRLIPRYFDLLVLLVECRDRAVHRQEIFDRVWADVIVSDGALSQAIRTLRRALGDDPREPQYIRTVSRHGYRFVHQDVQEETGEEGRPATPAWTAAGAATTGDLAGGDQAPPAFDELITRLLGEAGRVSDEERRDAAEQLHALGTGAAIDALRERPAASEALAVLRDARWDVAGAGDVPLGAGGDRLGVVAALVRVRLQRAARLASSRWASASAGGGIAGAAAGAIGGITLLLLPGAPASASIVLALALVGAVAGALGAAGVGAGLAAAEALARSQRALGLVICGGTGGAAAGLLAHAATAAVLGTLFGQAGLPVGGTLEGFVLGLSAGLGYALGTAHLPGGGMATPHGRSRVAVAALTGACCAVAGIGLALGGRHLVAASLDVLSSRFDGASVGLGPIARALGEGDLRPVTRTLVSGFEGLLFGAGLALGLTRRPHVHDTRS